MLSHFAPMLLLSFAGLLCHLLLLLRFSLVIRHNLRFKIELWKDLFKTDDLKGSSIDLGDFK